MHMHTLPLKLRTELVMHNVMAVCMHVIAQGDVCRPIVQTLAGYDSDV